MTDATSAAPELIRSYVNRILRLKEDQAELANDIRAVYGEAKAQGFDKTRLGEVVSYIAKRSVDASKVEEADAIFDLYLRAYDGKSGTEDANIDRAHTHAPDPHKSVRDSDAAAVILGTSEMSQHAPAGGVSEEAGNQPDSPASDDLPNSAAETTEGANASGLSIETRAEDFVIGSATAGEVATLQAPQASPALPSDSSVRVSNETEESRNVSTRAEPKRLPVPARDPHRFGSYRRSAEPEMPAFLRRGTVDANVPTVSENRNEAVS